MTVNQIQAINFLKELTKQLDSMSYEKIKTILNQFFSSLPIPILETDKIFRPEETHPRNYSLIYRARENEKFIPNQSTIKLPFKNLDEISIIPDSKKELIKSFGRCNKPKEPRFYSSNDLSTSCIEAITSGFSKEFSESKAMTVGTWKISKPLVLAQINYSPKSLAQFSEVDSERYKKMINYSKRFNEHNIKQISNQGNFDLEFISKLIEILSDEFSKIEIKGDFDYKICNYYCDHIFDNTTLEDGCSKIDGILYPSTSFAYQEMNLVLHPRALSKIEFVSAKMVWVTNSSKKGLMQFIPLEDNVRADENGNLQWKKFTW